MFGKLIVKSLLSLVIAYTLKVTSWVFHEVRWIYGEHFISSFSLNSWSVVLVNSRSWSLIEVKC